MGFLSLKSLKIDYRRMENILKKRADVYVRMLKAELANIAKTTSDALVSKKLDSLLAGMDFPTLVNHYNGKVNSFSYKEVDFKPYYAIDLVRCFLSDFYCFMVEEHKLPDTEGSQKQFNVIYNRLVSCILEPPSNPDWIKPSSETLELEEDFFAEEEEESRKHQEEIENRSEKETYELAYEELQRATAKKVAELKGNYMEMFQDVGDLQDVIDSRKDELSSELRSYIMESLGKITSKCFDNVLYGKP